MEVSAQVRQPAQPRPTQAYYVPRRLLENNSSEGDKAADQPPRGGKTTTNKASPPSQPNNGNSPKSPPNGKNNNSNNRQRNNSNGGNSNNNKPNNKAQSPTENRNGARPEPRPLMAEIIPRPASLKKEKSRPQRPTNQKQTRPTSRGDSKENHNSTEQTSPPLLYPRVITPSSLRSSNSPRSSVTTSPASSATPTEAEPCICERPTSHVVCRRCGYEAAGRVSRVCSWHPNKTALMDLRECPNPLCRSIQIIELAAVIVDYASDEGSEEN